MFMSTVSSPVVPSRPTAHAGFPPVPPSSFPSARWPRSSALATSPACSAPSTAAHCAAPTGSPRSLLPPPLPRGSRAPLLGVGRLLQTAVCWSRARACLSRALHPPRGPLQPSASTSSFAASCSTSCRPASSGSAPSACSPIAVVAPCSPSAAASWRTNRRPQRRPNPCATSCSASPASTSSAAPSVSTVSCVASKSSLLCRHPRIPHERGCFSPPSAATTSPR